MRPSRVTVTHPVRLFIQDGVLPCTLRGHKNVPPAVSRSGSSGPEDPTSVQRHQHAQAPAASGPSSEHTIPSNWPTTTIPHHNHHQFPVALGSDPGLLYPYMPYPPPTHPRPHTVKPVHPGPAALDQQLRSIFLKELLPSPYPPAPAAAAKPVPSVIVDHENAKYAAIAELLFKALGSAPDVFEPLPLPGLASPPQPAAGPPTEIPISKFDCDQTVQLKQLNSLLLSMPGSPSNAAPSPATPSATLPADVPQPPPSTALLPETGPAAAAPAPAPVAAAAAPAPVADPVAAAPTSASPPPPESIVATAPVQNAAQDTAPAAPAAVPAVPV